MSETIVITSGKGGVGKTTSAAGIGAALARYKNRVALIDNDVGLRNLDVILGLEQRVVYDATDVAAERCTLTDALVRHPAYDSLYLLPAAQTRDKGMVPPEAMRDITARLGDAFDYVIIDCPAGIGEGFVSACAGATGAIVVTNPEVSAVHDADRVIGLLSGHDIVAPRLIINKIRADMIRRGEMMSVADILDVLPAQLLGLICDDESVIKAGNMGMPIVALACPAASAYANIARRIMGQQVPFPAIGRRRRFGLLAALAGGISR